MARPLRDVRAMPQYPPLEAIGAGVDGAQVAAEWAPFCWPPQGMNCSDDIATLAPGQPRYAINLVPDVAAWRTRLPLGYVATTPQYVAQTTTFIVYARQVVDADGREWIIRWTTDGVDVLEGGMWVACTGPALSVNAYTKIAMAGWSNLVIFSDAASGMYALNMATKTYTLITGAPAAQHLTTFNLRVIASVAGTSRVQWCVARDYSDWTSTDLGAGYEDLLSAPDGSVDRQTAVLPISDEIAYCVRSNSIWQMEPTRNLAAPFAFARVIGSLGSRWPAACTVIPGGIAFMNDRGIYLFRSGQIEDLTPPIRKQFTGVAQSVLRGASMCYDQVGEQLRLAGDWTFGSDVSFVGGGYGDNGSHVLRWHFRIGGGWTVDAWEQGQRVRSVATTLDLRKRQTIGELTGTVGALTGVIGDLGVSAYQSGVMYVMYNLGASPDPTNWVAREAPDHLISPPNLGGVEAQGTGSSYFPLPSSILVGGTSGGAGHRVLTLGPLQLTATSAAAGSVTTGLSVFGFDRQRYALSGALQFAFCLTVNLSPDLSLSTSRAVRADFKHSGQDPWLQVSLSNAYGIVLTDLRIRRVDGALAGSA